jgi:transmembrane channel-like protein
LFCSLTRSRILIGSLRRLRYHSFEKDPIPLWRNAIREVESRLGMAIASYFVFLRWVILLNLVLAIIAFAFIIMPQVAAPERVSSSEGFSAISLITGQNYLATSPMFYQGYNGSLYISTSGSVGYNMAFAYIVCIGVMFFLSFSALVLAGYFQFSRVRDSTSLIRRNDENPFCSIVMSQWDYSSTSTSATHQLACGLVHAMRQLLVAAKTQEQKFSEEELKHQRVMRYVANFLSVCLLGGLGYCIYLLVDVQVDNPTNNAIIVLASFGITGINSLSPNMFSLIGRLDKTSNAEQHAMRTTMHAWVIRMAVLMAVEVSVWVTSSSSTSCWQNTLGQQFYRLAIIDILVSISMTILTNFGVKWFNVNIRKLEDPRVDFDMSKGILALANQESIVWIGSVWSPVLPCVVVIGQIINFWLKRFTYLRTARLPLNYMTTSKSSLLFYGTLFLSLLVVYMPTGYLIAKYDACNYADCWCTHATGLLSHSSTTACGAHASYSSIWAAVPSNVRQAGCFRGARLILLRRSPRGPTGFASCSPISSRSPSSCHSSSCCCASRVLGCAPETDARRAVPLSPCRPPGSAASASCTPISATSSNRCGYTVAVSRVCGGAAGLICDASLLVLVRAGARGQALLAPQLYSRSNGRAGRCQRQRQRCCPWRPELKGSRRVVGEPDHDHGSGSEAHQEPVTMFPRRRLVRSHRLISCSQSASSLVHT